VLAVSWWIRSNVNNPNWRKKVS
ncbi:aspartate kinase domain protein, partial [Vibrio parahaemolyticus V-223/04]